MPLVSLRHIHTVMASVRSVGCKAGERTDLCVKGSRSVRVRVNVAGPYIHSWSAGQKLLQKVRHGLCFDSKFLIALTCPCAALAAVVQWAQLPLVARGAPYRSSFLQEATRINVLLQSCSTRAAGRNGSPRSRVAPGPAGQPGCWLCLLVWSSAWLSWTQQLRNRVGIQVDLPWQQRWIQSAILSKQLMNFYVNSRSTLIKSWWLILIRVHK